MRITAQLYGPNGFMAVSAVANVPQARGRPTMKVGSRTVLKLRPLHGVALTNYTAQVRLPVDAPDRRRALAALRVAIEDEWHMTTKEE